MPNDTPAPTVLTLREDGQLTNSEGEIVFSSIDEARRAYNTPVREVITIRPGESIRFPR